MDRQTGDATEADMAKSAKTSVEKAPEDIEDLAISASVASPVCRSMSPPPAQSQARRRV